MAKNETPVKEKYVRLQRPAHLVGEPKFRRVPANNRDNERRTLEEAGWTLVEED